MLRGKDLKAYRRRVSSSPEEIPMKRTVSQKLPRGWTHKKIRALIDHYDQQTDEEGAAEIDSAPEASGETWMAVPIPDHRARAQGHLPHPRIVVRAARPR